MSAIYKFTTYAVKQRSIMFNVKKSTDKVLQIHLVACCGLVFAGGKLRKLKADSHYTCESYYGIGNLKFVRDITFQILPVAVKPRNNGV